MCWNREATKSALGDDFRAGSAQGAPRYGGASTARSEGPQEHAHRDLKPDMRRCSRWVGTDYQLLLHPQKPFQGSGGSAQVTTWHGAARRGDVPAAISAFQCLSLA